MRDHVPYMAWRSREIGLREAEVHEAERRRRIRTDPLKEDVLRLARELVWSIDVTGDEQTARRNLVAVTEAARTLTEAARDDPEGLTEKRAELERFRREVKP